ncbi:platelet-activating factor receptor [Leuresthes tenuis]|uniref:platelet-activating factor receptor n=1 Tax=Leuresthes tenuis TaxID=355514 RepID=UPI003B50BD05
MIRHHTDNIICLPQAEQAVTGSSVVESTANNSAFLESEFRYVLFPVIYTVIVVLGFFANVYILFILWCLRGAKAMGEIRIYMTNLTIADLLYVCTLPFWIGYYIRDGNWVYSEFMCQVSGSLYYINTYGSILFLGAISFNRYLAVTRPLDVASSDHRCRGIVVCVVIWLFIVSISIPNMTQKGTHVDSDNFNRCFEGYHNETNDEKRKVAVTHFLIIGMFFVVFSFVVVFNFLIAQALLYQKIPQSEFHSQKVQSSISRKSNRTISTSRKKPRGMKRRALQMLLAVVGVFVLCFLPHHIIQGPWALAVLNITEGWGHMDWDQDTRQSLNDAHQIALALMSLNSIFDPVVYYFATRKFQKLIVAHFKKLVKGEGCSHTVTSHVSLDSRDQSQRLHSIHHEPREE